MNANWVASLEQTNWQHHALLDKQHICSQGRLQLLQVWLHDHALLFEGGKVEVHGI